MSSSPKLVVHSSSDSVTPSEAALRGKAFEFSRVGVPAATYVELTAIVEVEKIALSTLYKRLSKANIPLINGLGEGRGPAVHLDAYLSLRSETPDSVSSLREGYTRLLEQALEGDSVELKIAVLNNARYFLNDPPGGGSS